MAHSNVIVGRDSVPEKPQPASGSFSHPDAGDEPHQPVQSFLPILLRVRRRQSWPRRKASRSSWTWRRPRLRWIFCSRESGDRRSIHITFFGGETLMNFPLLKQVVAYGNQRAEEQGRHIDFSLTTNATLLTPAIIEFLSEQPHRRHREHGWPQGDARSSAGLLQRQGQLRHHRAEGAGADPKPSHAADHGARHAHRGRLRRDPDFPPLETGPGIPRGGFRAGDHFAESALRDQRDGHGQRSGSVPHAGRRISGACVARRSRTAFRTSAIPWPNCARA